MEKLGDCQDRTGVWRELEEDHEAFWNLNASPSGARTGNSPKVYPPQADSIYPTIT